MANNNQINEPASDWPVTFESVAEAQLKQMLSMTPAKRLEMAEALLEFATMAGAVKERDSDPV